MINYISFVFIKESGLSTSQLHLFEHCVSSKITDLLEQKYNGEGIIFNAETFTDSVLIELFYSNSELELSLLSIITEIKFVKNDIDMISRELEVIHQETKLVDLTEEEKYLYKPLSYFTDLNIYDLYSSELDTSNIIVTFNNLLPKTRISSYQNGILTNKTGTNRIMSTSPTLRAKWKIDDNKIIGCYVSSIVSIKDLLLSKFISFIYGRSENSLISKEFLEPYNLYYGYTVDISIYDYFYSLFYVETSEISKKKFLDEPLLMQYFKLTQYEFKNYLEAFKTYLFMSDPLLLEINKYYAKIGFGESIDLKTLSDLLDSITLDELKNYFGECVVM